jgi:hypothetical protein
LQYFCLKVGVGVLQLDMYINVNIELKWGLYSFSTFLSGVRAGCVVLLKRKEIIIRRKMYLLILQSIAQGLEFFLMLLIVLHFHFTLQHCIHSQSCLKYGHSYEVWKENEIFQSILEVVSGTFNLMVLGYVQQNA